MGNTKGAFKKDDIIASVIRMRLVDMASTKTIIDFLTQKIGMSKVMAYEYLKWAREEIKEQYPMTNPAMIEEAIGQYETALEDARRRKDWKLWNELKKELNKITGITNKTQVDITTNGKDIGKITFEIIRNEKI
jgi:predicted metal-dependent phosphoesterase TrpH